MAIFFSHWEIFMIIRSPERRYCTSFLHYWRLGCIRCQSGTQNDADLVSFKPGGRARGEGLINPLDLFNVSGEEQMGSGFREEMPSTNA